MYHVCWQRADMEPLQSELDVHGYIEVIADPAYEDQPQMVRKEIY